jgi:tetratricopeptide (TPR) repeat protein
MSQRLTRKQIKRDEVGEALSRTMAFLSGHLKLVGAIAALLVALFALGTGIDRLLGGRRQTASDELAEAIQVIGAPILGEADAAAAPTDLPVFASENERSAAARERFEQLVEKHGRSRTGEVARTYLATLAFEDGDTETARELWEELAAGRDTVLAIQAELNLIAHDRESGRAAEVESRLLEQTDGSGVLPADVALWELGLTQEALGKTVESAATFRRLVEEHPRSAYAREAMQKAPASGESGS